VEAGTVSAEHPAATVYPETLHIGDLLDGVPIVDIITQYDDPLPYSDFIWVKTDDGRFWQMRTGVKVEGVERRGVCW
jgi:hypothetical protein